MSLIRISEHRNLWLLATFGIYLGILVVFATIYYALYREKAQNFAFNADILKAQQETFRALAVRDTTTTANRVGMLNLLMAALEVDSGSMPKRRDALLGQSHASIVQVGQYRFDLALFRSTLEHPSVTGDLRLIVTDSGGSEVASFLVAPEQPALSPISRTREEWRDLTRDLLADENSLLSRLRNRLATLGRTAPQVFSFWDFLYFATITQTTVGYGDILPNSTPVRLVVVVQLIVTTLLLVVVINLVATRRPASIGAAAAARENQTGGAA